MAFEENMTTFLKASTKNNLKKMEELVGCPHISPNQMLSAAIGGGHAHIVSLLLPKVNTKSIAWAHELRKAVGLGKSDIVQLLLPFTDKHQNHDALIVAIQKEKKDCVAVLIPVSECVNPNDALQWAASVGNIDIVRMLLPNSDPKGNNSEPLQSCVYNGYDELFDLLYPLSDPNAALQQMTEDRANQKTLTMLTQRMKAEREHQIIGENLSSIKQSARKKI